MTKQPKTIKIKISTLANIVLGILLTLACQHTLQFNQDVITLDELAIDANEKEYQTIKELKQLGFYDNQR